MCQLSKPLDKCDLSKNVPLNKRYRNDETTRRLPKHRCIQNIKWHKIRSNVALLRCFGELHFSRLRWFYRSMLLSLLPVIKTKLNNEFSASRICDALDISISDTSTSCFPSLSSFSFLSDSSALTFVQQSSHETLPGAKVSSLRWSYWMECFIVKYGSSESQSFSSVIESLGKGLSLSIASIIFWSIFEQLWFDALLLEI